MNIDQLLADPIGFVNEIAQSSDLRPDFGIHGAFQQVIDVNPLIVSAIPVVLSSKHTQLHPPGTFLRLRCVVNFHLYDEGLPLRVFKDGQFYTPVIPGDSPPECELPDRKDYIIRKAFAASSISGVTPWVHALSETDSEPLSVHLLSGQPVTVSPSNLDAPFTVSVKVLFDVPDVPSLAYDFFGFFEDPTFKPVFTNVSDPFLHSLPQFVALSASPVPFLYSPVLDFPPASVVRQHLLDFLCAFLDPLQAELLLLWLVGRTRAHVYSGLPMGIISLNFFRATPESASILIELLSQLCSALSIVPFTIESFNSCVIRPSRALGELRPTILSGVKDTRIVIDETGLEPGVLSAEGIDNLSILQDIASSQFFQFVSEGQLFDQLTSFPLLVFSNAASLIKTTISVPIGTVNSPELTLEPELVQMLRAYVEQARFAHWELDDEGSAFVAEQMALVLQSDKRVEQSDLHLLMFLDELNCVSLGSPGTNPEIWEHSLQIFTEIFRFRHNDS
jgi:hypothetical protein